MESNRSDAKSLNRSDVQGLELRLFGPLRLSRAGVQAQLPPSRKVRALVGYLAVAPHPVPRDRLCTLLWETPNDPRGELRWCLSKLRALVDEPARPRVFAADDRVFLDLEGCDVDALRLLGAARTGLDGLADAELIALAASAGSDFLEGAGDESVEFGHWLATCRNEFHSLHLDVVAAVAQRADKGTPDGLSAARRWLELAPLDAEAHKHFLAELFHRRMIDDCNRHLEAAARSFALESLDFSPVRDAWSGMRNIAAMPAMVAPSESWREAAQQPARRSSVAVMPFRELRFEAGRSALGDALTHDVISRLARLRNLLVIARGSVFAVAEEGLDLRQIGGRLGVDYVTTGCLEPRGDTILVTVEIAEAASAHIVWTEQFEAHSSEPLAVLDEIGDGIVSSIAVEIENAERNRAILKHPDSLDAWEAYHRGLWHMYRFTVDENARAAEFFRLSARLDPTFSRAYAGLSFTHWQNAFQRWGHREAEARQALETAGQSLLIDDHNPAARWSMGRALWLAGDNGGAVCELERSVQLSPNFALGHYSLAFVHSQAGDPAAAVAASDHSRLLSPCDPLLFGMLGARAIALVRLGSFDEAAEWGLKAAARPNAHVHILAIAAHCLALAGRIDEARNLVVQIRLQSPGYRADDFLDTFRFEVDARQRFLHAAALIGLKA